MSRTTGMFDIQDYIEASTDAAKRTRAVTIVLVIASVLVFIGFYNSFLWSWPHDRLRAAYDPDDQTIYGTLEVDKHPKIFPSPMFGAGDFMNPRSLARKLKNGEDPLSTYLYSNLRPETQSSLEMSVDTRKFDSRFLPELAKDFNERLKDPSLYDPKRFGQVILKKETEALVNLKPTEGELLIRLNRSLLEDAYPYEIAKSLNKPVSAEESPNMNPADKFRSQLQWAGARGYVENVRFIRIPFFGIAFDVNDLGIFGGIGFIIILFALRHSVSNEIKSLKFSFREAEKEGQLYHFYHALAMRQVFTVPEMEEEKRNKWLAISAKIVCILPAIIFTIGLVYDFWSVLHGRLFKIEYVGGQLYSQIVLWLLICYLSARCWERQRHIDGIWDDFWKRINKENSSVVLLDHDLVKEFGTDEAANKALRKVRTQSSESLNKV